MDYKIVIARGGNDEIHFKTFAEASLRKLGMNDVYQVHDKLDANETIFIKYNAGIEALLQNQVKDDDIVIFMHSDVGVIDPWFKQKLEMIFSEKKDVGLVGVVGTTEWQEQGGWWDNNKNKLKGHVLQGKEGAGIGDGFHLVKGDVGYFDNIVMIDGLFMATLGRIIKEGLRLDDKLFDTGNDFYDGNMSYEVLKMGYKIAVADIMLYHQSSGLGALKDTWKVNHDKMINKIKTDGYKFPLYSEDFKKKTITNEIIEIEI